MKTHLTLTGYYAGMPICGASRNPGDKFIHAAYLDDSELINPPEHACMDCVKIMREVIKEEQDEVKAKQGE